MVVCTYEDRPAALVGLKLLILSMQRHCPDLRVVACVPNGGAEFEQWCKDCPQVELDPQACGRCSGWNAKPSLLLAMLDRGYEEVVWLDSDIILTADFRPLLYGCAPRSVVVSQAQYWDIYQHGSDRTRLWNLEIGRALPYVASTGVVRVTPEHRPLLEEWRDMLRNPAYLRAQKRHLYKRPIHMLGDQDVFTALLASKQFGEIPLVYLCRGRDIILSVGPAGYTLGERLSGMFRDLAPLIHCGGTKPWDISPAPEAGEGFATRYERTYIETSPYAWAARPYAAALGEPMAGLEIRTRAGRVCIWLTRDHPALQGLPQALVHTILRRIKHALGITAWPTATANVEPPTAELDDAIKHERIEPAEGALRG